MRGSSDLILNITGTLILGRIPKFALVSLQHKLSITQNERRSTKICKTVKIREASNQRTARVHSSSA